MMKITVNGTPIG